MTKFKELIEALELINEKGVCLPSGDVGIINRLHIEKGKGITVETVNGVTGEVEKFNFYDLVYLLANEEIFFEFSIIDYRIAKLSWNYGNRIQINAPNVVKAMENLVYKLSVCGW